jgi:bacterioferritin (cytochrome b1)
MSGNDAQREKLIEMLNGALGWEMRAAIMYAHYGAYVQGMHRLHLKPFFEGESTESMTHATTVRGAIVKLGGVARTDRDRTQIVHTTDFKVMLEEAMKTETRAAETYGAILELGGLDAELADALQQIHFAEQRAVEELGRLL